MARHEKRKVQDILDNREAAIDMLLAAAGLPMDSGTRY